MSSANARSSTKPNITRPQAAPVIKFNPVQFGLWRAEHGAHTFEIRIVRAGSKSTHYGSKSTHYVGRAVIRATGEIICDEIKEGRYADCQRRLVAGVKITKPARATTAAAKPMRALCTFEDFTTDGVEAKLQRRRDVYLKRWNLISLSERFQNGNIKGQATTMLVVATESAAS